MAYIKKIALLPRVIIAIVLGICCGLFFPRTLTTLFITFNALFSNFLVFFIPLLILGLVAPAIADLGRRAGKLLLYTAVLAYLFTIFTGYFAYFSCQGVYPSLLAAHVGVSHIASGNVAITPWFTIDMPPVFGVMTALILAFMLGLGMSLIDNNRLKGVMDDFKEIIILTINGVIIPLLPLYIFGIFLNMTYSGQVTSVLAVFSKIFIFIFILSLLLLLVQFGIAGIFSRKNPLKMLKTMLPAYATALGTQSSAATIPVTLAQTIKLGVRPELASFVIPLCATVHLSGSMLKIVACALAIMLMTGMSVTLQEITPFIFILAVTMFAAPGVPGGAIMAALGVLQSVLGFDETAQGLMIALYIAMDSFGTATNVTGDGAIASIINILPTGNKSDKKTTLNTDRIVD